MSSEVTSEDVIYSKALQPFPPSEISSNGMHAGSFGKAEVEWAAGDLLRFFQEKGSWEPFHIPELVSFYQRHKLDESRMLFGLIGQWEDDAGFFPYYFRQSRANLVFLIDGRLAVTREFLENLKSAQ